MQNPSSQRGYIFLQKNPAFPITLATLTAVDANTQTRRDGAKGISADTQSSKLNTLSSSTSLLLGLAGDDLTPNETSFDLKRQNDHDLRTLSALDLTISDSALAGSSTGGFRNTRVMLRSSWWAALFSIAKNDEDQDETDKRTATMVAGSIDAFSSQSRFQWATLHMTLVTSYLCAPA